MPKTKPTTITEPASPFVLPPALAAKLGSIVVHMEELSSADGHSFDKIAIEALVADSDVQAWISQLRGMALVPVKRKG